MENAWTNRNKNVKIRDTPEPQNAIQNTTKIQFRPEPKFTGTGNKNPAETGFLRLENFDKLRTIERGSKW